MEEICSLCEGTGLRIVEEGGRQVARPCECRVARRAARMLEQAHIPRRYEHCTLDSYIVSGSRGDDHTLARAHWLARKFVQHFHGKPPGSGLLFTGSVGVGKTHLAVGILKRLIQDYGVQGTFCDYRELLKEVQNSYNQNVAATEMQVLRPIFEAEVLVLDELGASKPSEWVWDTVAHVLNTRYNDLKTTIITTNYSNAGPLGAENVPAPHAQPDTAAGEEARAAMKKDTLGDRIGERMRSRLQEMCVVVEMYGKDYRENENRASFASGKKLTIATSELKIGTGANDPNANKVFHNGVWEEMITGDIRSEDCADAIPEPAQEQPVVGRDRMGKSKRVPRDVKVS
jgi:DNA replication protein DnaC